jgi:tRNA A37 threonylcarbamoyladenosine dehydratase
MHPFHRTELLVGQHGFEKLRAARIMVVGLGGVGSWAAEAIARAGIGTLTLVDFDDVCLTNLNRQLHATRRTVGASKAGLMADRVRQINPKATVRCEQLFYDAETSERLLGEPHDVVLDAIDNVTAKVHLLAACHARGQRVISAMGAGGRIDPTRVRITDLSRTQKDPLARVVRKELRKLGIVTGIECAWTDEEPNVLDADVEAAFRCICPTENEKHSCDSRNVVQGTVPWVPAIFGMMMAGAAVNRLLARPVHSADRERDFVAAEAARAHADGIVPTGALPAPDDGGCCHG